MGQGTWVHVYERLGTYYADVGCIYADVGCLSKEWLGESMRMFGASLWNGWVRSMRMVGASMRILGACLERLGA